MVIASSCSPSLRLSHSQPYCPPPLFQPTLIPSTTPRLLCVFGAGGEHLHTLGAEAGSARLCQLSWLGEDQVLACSGEEITVWSVSQEQYKELRTFASTHKAPIHHIATSPNGRFIAAACDNGAVSGLITAGGQEGMGGELLCCFLGAKRDG